MRIARRLELRLEKMVEGLSATLFRGRMHSVDLANRLIRFVDLSMTEGATGPEIANIYAVRINPAEIDPAVDLNLLDTELAAAVEDTAAENGWRLGGPVTVTVERDPKTATGSIRCDTDRIPGEISPWGQLISRAEADVLDLGDNRVLIGRGSDVDVVVPLERVSRHHAVVIRRAGSVWITDLDSANGTEINGESVGRKAMEVRPGDVVSLGPATFSLRLL